MAQRISRAKQTHQDVGRAVSSCRPTSERAERLGAVLHVLYLIFNEGYASERRPGPAAQRSRRARRSGSRARCTALLPDDAEVAGLLALMLLTDARRAARTGAGRRADSARRAGSVAVGSRRRSPKASRSSARRSAAGAVGAYQLQAAIAAVHDEAARAEDTDWPQILALYGLLDAHVRQSDGHAQPRDRGWRWCTAPAAGLELLDALDARRAPGRPLSPRRRARASARDGGRSRGGDRALPRGRGDERRACPSANYLAAKAATLQHPVSESTLGPALEWAL